MQNIELLERLLTRELIRVIEIFAQVLSAQMPNAKL